MTDKTSGLHSLLERQWGQLSAQAVGPDALATVELYLPVSAGHVRVAVDDRGQRHLLIPFSTGVPLQADTRSGGVHLLRRPLVIDEQVVQFADIHCLTPTLNSVFVAFYSSLLEVVSAHPNVTPQQVHELLLAWRDLLSDRPLRWTRARVAGFFSELVVLERVLRQKPTAVDAWRGPFRAPQDFRSAGGAIEVKASTGQEGRLVSVHGTDQLLAPEGGVLWLAWMRLAIVGGAAGRSVDDVLTSSSSLTTDPALLRAAVEAARWESAPKELAELRFEVSEERWYRVAPGFPRITTAELPDAALPEGVTRVSYQLDLDVLADPGKNWSRAVADLLGAT